MLGFGDEAVVRGEKSRNRRDDARRVGAGGDESLADMRCSLLCDHEEPIPDMACEAPVDQTPKAVRLYGLADNGRNAGERRARDAAGGEDASTQIQAAAARQDVAGASAAQVEACEGITHVGHGGERSGQLPGEGSVQSIGILHGAFEQPLQGSEPEESVITASMGLSGRGQSQVDFAREDIVQRRLGSALQQEKPRCRELYAKSGLADRMVALRLGIERRLALKHRGADLQDHTNGAR